MGIDGVWSVWYGMIKASFKYRCFWQYDWFLFGARWICSLCLNKASDQKFPKDSIEKMEKNRAYRVPKEVEKDTKIVKIHSCFFLDLFGHPRTFVMDFSYDTLLPQRHFHHMWRECHVKHPPPIWRSNSRAKKPHRVLPGDWGSAA